MNLRDIKNEIKWAYQRVRYGYDETIKWGFCDYFWYFVQPLKEFCEEQLLDIKVMDLNPERKAIFTETLKRISAYETMTLNDEYKQPNQASELWEYVGKYLNYYWD